MSYILGLDTGGTYTDGVLIDTETEHVKAKSKALTTKYDLNIGIGKCIDDLKIHNPDGVKMVSLSTTLATNAVVEGTWGKAGLIICGGNLKDSVPTKYIERIAGKTDIKGNVIIPASEEHICRAVDRLKTRVEAIAVSSYASVRNPQEELKIKKIAEERCGLPVFCAHELTGSLGFAERTNTAVLNAGLIGIVRDFIEATKISLKSKGIDAEIMIVKSDGSLMREKMALKRPIETILSGPAASAIGALKLTGERNAIILDMGGTTIDIAEITDGTIKTGDGCASIAGWQTRVNALEVSTYGIGGDSHIVASDGIKMRVGPQKAEPISRVSSIYDNIICEIRDIQNDPDLSKSEKERLSRCYCLTEKDGCHNGDIVRNMIINCLTDRPHSMGYLVGKAGDNISEILKEMIKSSEINIVDITPTDLLHITGKYSEWDPSAARIRAEIVASAAEMSIDDFVSNSEEAVYRRIYTACMQAVSDFEEKNISLKGDAAAEYLIDKMFSNTGNDFLRASCRLKKQVIAVGAPVKTWLPCIAEKLNTGIVIPEDADVANAVGSAFGEINEAVEALIRKENDKRIYNLYLPDERQVFYSKKAAVEEAEIRLITLAKEKALLAGCSSPEIRVEKDDRYINPFGEKRRKYTETHIKVSANGRPDMWSL